MQFTVDCGFNATAEAQAANDYPNIRVMTVGTEYYSNVVCISLTLTHPLRGFLILLFQSLAELKYTYQPWTVASASSIGAGNWTYPLKR